MSKVSQRQNEIINLLQRRSDPLSSSEIIQLLKKSQAISEITIKRDLSELVESGILVRTGKARAIKYSLSPGHSLIREMDVDAYFEADLDDRKIKERFQFQIFDQIQSINIFSTEEESELTQLLTEYEDHKSQLSPTLVKREFERLTIELSWKSSVIEGNTYSLLETETLLKEGIRARGKKQEDAIMLLNHKHCLDFIRKNTKDFKKINVKLIEEIHQILVQDLEVSANIRKSLVAITGTRYRPLDNEFQIREALEKTCTLINKKKNPIERAFWAVLLISYIQPFEDGNKRTGRMLSSGLLLFGDMIPLSYRSVKVDEYKKAVLLFYERNNIAAFKKLFLEQVRFAVKNYFRVRA